MDESSGFSLLILKSGLVCISGVFWEIEGFDGIDRFEVNKVISFSFFFFFREFWRRFFVVAVDLYLERV